MKTYGVIMAGGGGTRFWPLSRKQTPKQLLNLTGKEIMVNEAIDRLAGVCLYDDIFIVTNKTQAEKMARVTQGRIRADHILAEPAARNTAACIGYAAAVIMKKYGDGVMVVTPSDAYVKDGAAFVCALKDAVHAAETGDGLVTVGITPTFPATGYGYIKYADVAGRVKPVERFVEKPCLEKAEEYIRNGGYCWNSGMFIWKASVILEKFKELLPDLYASLGEIAASFGTDGESGTVELIYPTLRSVSIDYGIMEKSDKISVVPAEFGWNDVGSWDMMGVLHAPDGDGNVQVGDTLLIDTKNVTAYSDGKLVAAVGVENLIVVRTDDAVLVCAADRAQDVKLVTERLKKEGREELL